MISIISTHVVVLNSSLNGLSQRMNGAVEMVGFKLTMLYFDNIGSEKSGNTMMINFFPRLRCLMTLYLSGYSAKFYRINRYYAIIEEIRRGSNSLRFHIRVREFKIG